MYPPNHARTHLEAGEAVADLPDALGGRDDAEEQDLLLLHPLLEQRLQRETPSSAAGRLVSSQPHSKVFNPHSGVIEPHSGVTQPH